MIIGIDIGNSTTVIAVVDNNLNIRKKTTLFNPDGWTVTKVCNTIDTLCASVSSKSRMNMALVICSVVPEKTEILMNACLRKYKFRIEHVSVSKVNWFSVNYFPKKSFGEDRLCNVIAARELYGCSTIVIDFGTATTFNVIDGKGDFIGGLISPGLDTMRKSLIRNTSQLPDFHLHGSFRSIAVHTKSNLQAGLLLFNQFGWEGIVRHIAEEQKSEFQVVITGGMSKLVSSISTARFIRDADLLLKGLKIYSDRIS